jgi:hypothetical protein
MSTSTTTQLYIVSADYRCEKKLVGHSGCSYASPPQPATQALELVRILINASQNAIDAGEGTWRRPAAGGTLTVQLIPAAPDGQLT